MINNVLLTCINICIFNRCKHYFCEKCVLENYKKSTRCFICATQTNGVFNPAKEIIARIGRGDNDAEVENSDSSD